MGGTRVVSLVVFASDMTSDKAASVGDLFGQSSPRVSKLSGPSWGEFACIQIGRRTAHGLGLRPRPLLARLANAVCRPVRVGDAFNRLGRGASLVRLSRERQVAEDGASSEEGDKSQIGGTAERDQQRQFGKW